MEESGHYAAVETLSLEHILITEHLATRPSRTPDYEAETQAIHTLTQALAMGSSGLLQSLVETAVLLCHAGTAGISILEETGATRVFRWCNMAGELAGQAGQSTPGEFSPCGVTLALDTPQLFDRPYRHFTYFQASPAPIEEGLVIPLRTPGQPPATIWIVGHDPHWRSEAVKENFGGNGIGLTSVLQIIELHGGTIRVESEEGQGSTFSIQLPLAIAEAVILSA